MLEMQIFGINGALEQEWKQAPSGGVTSMKPCYRISRISHELQADLLVCSQARVMSLGKRVLRFDIIDPAINV